MGYIRTCTYIILCCTGVGQPFNVTIISDPIGIPLNGSINTFVYPLLSYVELMCVTSPFIPSTTFQWNVEGCTTCFPNGQTTQNVTENRLILEDAGTFTCTATDGSTPVTSAAFILRVYRKLISHCVLMHKYLIESFTIDSVLNYQRIPYLATRKLIKYC